MVVAFVAFYQMECIQHAFFINSKNVIAKIISAGQPQFLHHGKYCCIAFNVRIACRCRLILEKAMDERNEPSKEKQQQKCS